MDVTRTMAALVSCSPARRWVRACAAALALCGGVLPTLAHELPEYQVKAGFVYNFAVLTTWPADMGDALKLCVYGHDPFGPELDALGGKLIGSRTLSVERKNTVESLKTCQIVFIPDSEAPRVVRIVEALRGLPVLTIAENAGAAHAGVMLNLRMVQDRITFEVNQGTARRAGLQFSAKLLRLATEVLP